MPPLDLHAVFDKPSDFLSKTFRLQYRQRRQLERQVSVNTSASPAFQAAAATTHPLLFDVVFAALLNAMEDYCVDNRGDVGSW